MSCPIHKNTGAPPSPSFRVATQVLNSLAPVFQASLTRHVSGFKNDLDPRRILELIENRQFNELEALIGDAGLAEHLEDVVGDYQGAIELSASEQRRFLRQSIQTQLGISAAELSFEPNSLRIQRWTRQKTGNLIRAVSATQREAVRAMIEDAFVEGLPPRRAAQMVRDAVGLSPSQSQAVRRFRTSLEFGNAQSAFTDFQQGVIGRTNIDQLGSLSSSKIDELTEKYAKEQIKLRSKTIARTEMQQAINFAQQESWTQAQEQGLLPPDARKQWVTAGDERVSDIDRPMEGVTVPVGDKFKIPLLGAAIDGPPSHPNCRCHVKLILRRNTELAVG